MLARLLGKQHEDSSAAVPAPAAIFRRGHKKRQIAAILGCSEKTIDRLIAAGELKAHRLMNGRRVHIVILGDDFEAFLAKTRVAA